jgi:hypothetical protein
MSEKASGIKRIFIFDPCFGELTGHWENYCKRLYHELVDRGYSVKVYGQKKFNPKIVAGVNFEPVFKHSPFENYTDVFDFRRRTALFLENFNEIAETEFQDGDLFVFHSLFPDLMAAILEWTQQNAVNKKIISALFFQLPPAEAKAHLRSPLKKLYHTARSWLPKNKENRAIEWLDNNNVRFYQFSADLLNALITKGSHVLFASTSVLQRNFSTMLRVPIHHLPMPGEKMMEVLPLLNNENKAESSTIKIGYFGHSSFAKGGQFLQYLVQKTLKYYPQVKFILHINPNPETAPYLEFFKTYHHPNVTCYFGHLEQDQMMTLLKGVDVVLLPYAPHKYALAPSAVFTEAFPLQKVFVIPMHTWIYEEATKYGAGFVSYSHYNQRSILKALLKLLSNFKKLKMKSKDAGTKFHLENNISTYIDVVMQTLNKKTIVYDDVE